MFSYCYCNCMNVYEEKTVKKKKIEKIPRNTFLPLGLSRNSSPVFAGAQIVDTGRSLRMAARSEVLESPVVPCN